MDSAPRPAGFPCGSDGNVSTCSAGDLSASPGSGRSPEKGMAAHSSILPADFHGQRSLADHSPWGCNESDTTEHACPGLYDSKHHSKRSINIYSMSRFTLLHTLSFPSAAILVDGSAAPAIMRPESKQSF